MEFIVAGGSGENLPVLMGDELASIALLELGVIHGLHSLFILGHDRDVVN
jgi:hypothetical protein